MAGKAILVIDSDSETAQRIESALESQDYLVFIASTEEFGITMARKVKPALIFVNPAIEGGSGLDICRTIHGMETLGSVPVIVLSPFEGELDPRYRLEYGIVDALGKAFTPEELISKTAKALSLKVSEATHPPDEESTPDERPGEREKEEMPETEQEVPWEEPMVLEEAPKTEEPPEGEGSRPFATKKAPRRRRSQGSRLAVPAIAAAILVILAAAGFVLYKAGLIGEKEVKRPAMVKTPPAGAQKSPEVAHPPVSPSAPATAGVPAVPPTVPTPGHEPESPGKPAYSVQIGAFRNEKNAEALVQQFKEKGYDAFVQTIPRDKEMLHRVLIGRFGNRKEAGKLAAKISSKEKVRVVVTRGG